MSNRRGKWEEMRHWDFRRNVGRPPLKEWADEVEALASREKTARLVLVDSLDCTEALEVELTAKNARLEAAEKRINVVEAALRTLVTDDEAEDLLRYQQGRTDE